MYARAAPRAREVVADLSARGRYHFTSAELRSALGVSAAAARQALSRLGRQGRHRKSRTRVLCHRTARVPQARLPAGRAVRPRAHGTPEGPVLRSAVVRRTVPRRRASSPAGVPGHPRPEQARDFVARLARLPPRTSFAEESRILRRRHTLSTSCRPCRVLACRRGSAPAAWWPPSARTKSDRAADCGRWPVQAGGGWA